MTERNNANYPASRSLAENSQQFRCVLKTTEMKDMITGEAIPLGLNSRYGAAA
jgi:hypothetical protein